VGKKKSNFFDSRDKYLSFINSTNEKSKIAFEIATYLKKTKIKGDAFKIFDAGTGDGTIISTLLSAVHDKFPQDPIIVVGKEISIDDINALLSYLGYRFYEHKNLVFCITNVSYQDIYNQNFDNCKFLKKELIGNSSFNFNQQLMGMSDVIKKNWELKEDSASTVLKPKQKSFMAIYRKDQKISLNHLIPKKLQDIPKLYDFVIASQAFRLRSPYQRTLKLVLLPLLRMLDKKGQLFFIYSSGNDFTKKILNQFFPKISPFQYSDPKVFISNISNNIHDFKKKYKVSVSSLLYSFLNISLSSTKKFSPMNSLGLWNAITYVGQISEDEQKKIAINVNFLDKISNIAKKLTLNFKDNILHFQKKGE
jgi:hypothetical protein